MARIILSIEGIKQDLKQGLTRLSSDPNRDPEIGSIEEKYDLSKTQVQAVFKDPRLKGLKTVKPKAEAEITFQEDLNDTLPEGTLNVSESSTAIPVGAEERGVSELLEESNVTEYRQPTTIHDLATESIENIESSEEDLTVSTVEEALAENNTAGNGPGNSF